jgi:uncharacterized protein YlxW (UPF0749 family)
MPESEPESRPERPETKPSGRQRLMESLLRPSRRQVVVGVLLALVGFGAVTQVRANEVDNTYAGLRQQDLIDTLNNLKNAESRADAEIARLEQNRTELETSTNRREVAIAQAEQLTDTLDILAGLVPVTGPGLRVTIEETDQEIDIDTMLDTVQELRNAGAEAMEFNDKYRVVAQTSFEVGVGGILVDGQLVEPPYVIDVIGEPTTLERSGLRFPSGPLEQLSGEQAEVEVDASDQIDITAVVEADEPKYAEPE